MESPVEWQLIETAPRDRPIRVRTANGDEDIVQWQDERYCMIGAPQGSYGPGWVDLVNKLPVMEDHAPDFWRPVE